MVTGTISQPGRSGERAAPQTRGAALIEMRDIYKVFKTSAGDFPALKGINADFYPGEFVSIVGKSGSGKSTLANMITGIDHPTSGTVCVQDTCVHDLSEAKMSIWRGRNLGIVFQFFQLLPMLTLLENVMLPMDFCNMYAPEERERRALELLERVGLREVAGELPAEVSGGQQQTTAIARALANDPPIIIADEPTGNLDSRTAEVVFEIFKELASAGKTVIMVTHDSALASRTDRTLLLSDGELINEWIAQALRPLPHPRLLWLTKQVQPAQFRPGESLPRPDGKSAGMYVVTRGSLEIVLNGDRRREPLVAALGPGECLSPLHMQASGKALSGLRASTEEGVEVLSLRGEDFEAWMRSDAGEQKLLDKVARERAARWLAAKQPGQDGQA